MQDSQFPRTGVPSCEKLTWGELGAEDAPAVGAALFARWLYFPKVTHCQSDVLPDLLWLFKRQRPPREGKLHPGGSRCTTQPPVAGSRRHQRSTRGVPGCCRTPGKAKPPAGRLLCRAAWSAPTPSSVSGNAACSDMASEIPNMQLHEKVTAQSEQRIKH